LAFLTIEVADNLDKRDRRRAAAAGPPAIATRSTYPSLLRTAGLASIERIDVTADYRVTASARMDARNAHAQAFADEFGADELRERNAEGERRLSAIDDGLLKRFLYVAHRR
jgi:hypothetical protein